MREIRWDGEGAHDIRRALDAAERELSEWAVPELRQALARMDGNGTSWPRDTDEQARQALRQAEALCGRLKRLASNLEAANRLMLEAETKAARLAEQLGHEALIGGSSLSAAFSLQSGWDRPFPAAAGGLSRFSDMIVPDWLDSLASSI